MNKSSGLNRGLWALAYVVGGAAGIYGTMWCEGADFQTVLAACRTQDQREKPVGVSLASSFRVVASGTSKQVQESENRTEIGPFPENDAPKEKGCALSDEDIKVTQEVYNNDIERMHAGGQDPLQDYAFLVQRAQRMDGCLDNLRVYGWDKKEYLPLLRRASIGEAQREYQELARNSDDRNVPLIVDRILRVAAYAGISDEGDLNVAAGLKAASLLDENSLRDLVNKSQMGELLSMLNGVRSYTGSEDWEARHRMMADTDNLRAALSHSPKLAAALGISDAELQKMRDKLQNDDDRDPMNNQTVQETPPEP